MLAECGGYVGPSTTADLKMIPSTDDLQEDIHGKFVYADGVLKLLMSGGGFTISIR